LSTGTGQKTKNEKLASLKVNDLTLTKEDERFTLLLKGRFDLNPIADVQHRGACNGNLETSTKVLSTAASERRALDVNTQKVLRQELKRIHEIIGNQSHSGYPR
jgi:hypothetical protein